MTVQHSIMIKVPSIIGAALAVVVNDVIDYCCAIDSAVNVTGYLSTASCPELHHTRGISSRELAKREHLFRLARKANTFHFWERH